MVLTAEQKKRVENYTGGVWQKERAIRARDFISRNRITNEEDIREVAEIAAVSMEDVK